MRVGCQYQRSASHLNTQSTWEGEVYSQLTWPDAHMCSLSLESSWVQPAAIPLPSAPRVALTETAEPTPRDLLSECFKVAPTQTALGEAPRKLASTLSRVLSLSLDTSWVQPAAIPPLVCSQVAPTETYLQSIPHSPALAQQRLAF